MRIDPIEIIVLRADEGKVLTNGETYSNEVYLGIHDSPENWHEIAEEDIPEEEINNEEIEE